MESREYKIIIESKGGGASDSGTESAVAGSKTPSPKKSIEDTGGILSKDGAKNYLAGMVAWRTVKPYLTQVINHEVSLVELRTGSRELQNRANFVNQMVQQSVNTLEMVATGALVGGGAGAFVGLATSLVHTGISYMQASNKIELQKTLENRSIEMQVIRASAYGSRRS